jgi:hypothetical protein
MKKCLISEDCKTIQELEGIFRKVGVKVGYVGKVVEYVAIDENAKEPLFVHVELPCFYKQRSNPNEWEYNKVGHIVALLPYKVITEVEEDEINKL